MSPSGERPSLLAAIGSLLYLDLRRTINQLRAILTDPKKLVIWLSFVAFMTLVVVGNSVGPRERIFLGEEGMTAALPVPSLTLAIVGLIIYMSARRAPALFTAAADGRFLIGSGFSSRLVVLWLHLRVFARYPVAFLPWAIILSVAQSGVAGIPDGLAAFAALTLAAIIISSLRLPVFMAAGRWGVGPFLAIGAIAIVVGLGGTAATLSRNLPNDIALPGYLVNFAPDLPPGTWVAGALAGDLISILALSACALVTVVLTIAVAGDTFPELWEASTRIFALQAAARKRGARGVREMERELRGDVAGSRSLARPRAARRDGRSPGGFLLTGAWTLLWKEWLGRARRTSGLPAPVWWTLLGLAAGVGFGIASWYLESDALYGLLSSAIFMSVLFAAMQGSVHLAEDLGKPLWGFSAAPVRARLAVYILAATLLWTAPVGGGLAAFGVVSGNLPLAAWAIPLVGAMYWLLHTGALLIYTVIPGGGLMNQPMMMLRMFSTLLLLIPVAIVAIAVAIAASSLGLGRVLMAPLLFVTLTLAGVIEGWLLVQIAAVRIRERGLEFALAEEG